MASTARFGLTLTSSLTDHDKALVDAVLSALELHDHLGGARLVDPTGPPAGALSPVGGSLQAGVTFYYRLSYIDQFGLETAASEEVAFTTPLPAPTPAVPTASSIDGGLLSVGVYYYALSAVDASNNQTGLSTPATVTIIAANSSVNITGRAFDAGVTAYNVWRQGPRSSGYTLLGQISDPTVVFLDNGFVPDDPLACDPSSLPPTNNSTNATSVITFNPADPVIVGTESGPVKAWRLYRSTTSGSYGVTSLLSEINTTVNLDGTGGLTLDYVDDGTATLLTGQPKELSETLHPSIQIVTGNTASGALIFPANTDGSHYRVICADDGTLVSRLSPGGYYNPSVGNIYLRSDPTQISYRLTIADDGTLSTLAADVASGDTLYPMGQGPDLPSPDPTISYKLGVTDDGALTTTEV